MNSELLNLLQTVAVEADGNSFTHVTLYDTIKRWRVKDDSYAEFWRGYCNLVDNGDNGLCLAEKNSNMTPLIVNLKFKFHVEEYEDHDNLNLYDYKFLSYLCHIYQSVLIELFDFEDNLISLVVSIFEATSNYYEIDDSGKRCLVNTLRLQFPFAKINNGIQKRLIRPRVLDLLKNSEGITHLTRAPLNNWNDIISDDFDSPVLLYGSTNSVNQPKMELTSIWPWITIDMIENDSIPEQFNISEIFDPINHKHVHNDLITDSLFDESDDPNHWLPLIFSVDYWDKAIKLKKEDNERFPVPESTNIKLNINGWNASAPEDKSVDLCLQILPFLSKERFTNETSWLDIGKALHFADNGKSKGLEVWINFSQKMVGSNIPSFMLARGSSISATCTSVYRTLAGKPITEKTIAHYARMDEPNKYSEWHKNWSVSAIGKSITFSHTDVAVAIWKVYWLDFLYCPTTDKWYQFCENKWTEDIKALQLSKLISSDFISRMQNVKECITEKAKNSSDVNAAENAITTNQKIDALILKLKTGPFKNNVIAEARTLFKNYKFERCRDANPNLLGVSNGVLEVVTNHIEFRPAKPEDYVLLNTEIPFDDTLTWESKDVQDCMAWFTKVFPDESLRHHFLKFASSCIKGRNSDKIFPIFTGEGNNSKSMIVKLFMSTFGNYAIKFDMANVTTRNNNPGSASPHLARAKAVRLGFMDEAADDVPMHKETIKRVIGGDSFFTRKLHDNGGDIEVFFKLILSCNKVPIIPKADTAIKNRVRIFPFDSVWGKTIKLKDGEIEIPKDGIVIDGIHYFQADPLFEESIPGMAPAFLWILVNYYPRYYTDKLNDPEIVKERTKAYWDTNDVYAQFTGDCLNVNKDNTSKISFTELYAKFRMWYKDSFDGVKVPEKPAVKSEFQARFGRLTGKYWYGISLIQDDYGHDPRPAAEQTKPVAQQEIKPTAATPKVVVTKADKSVISKTEIVKSIADKIDKSVVSKTAESEIMAKSFNVLNKPAITTEMINEVFEPESVKSARKYTDLNKQEFVGDIPTRLLSPGIIAGTSGEIRIEDEDDLISNNIINTEEEEGIAVDI